MAVSGWPAFVISVAAEVHVATSWTADTKTGSAAETVSGSTESLLSVEVHSAASRSATTGVFGSTFVDTTNSRWTVRRL
ncbi:unnamed protein product [Lupinus luteus]|uniref:Secreted protein n=1 Tax=Lupinus luteus TaxID=3873 RepID=A0AAV1YGS7_LUPLU